MTERSVVVGRDGRAKAYRPLPEAQRAAALAAGPGVLRAGRLLRGARGAGAGLDGHSPDLAERALLQGLIKVAAAYVHDVRGNPPGITRNLEGARALLVDARSTGPAGNPAGIDVDALIAAIDLRLADLADHPDGPTLGPPELRRSLPMNQPPPIPTVDVTEAERRLREDPDRPILLDVREASEFAEVRAPGAVLVPTSSFMTRVGELPADRPLLSCAMSAAGPRPSTGYLIRAGRTDVVNVAGGMEAWERAGLPVRRGPLEPGEGDLPG